jgi:hypothetical protein
MCRYLTKIFTPKKGRCECMHTIKDVHVLLYVSTGRPSSCTYYYGSDISCIWFDWNKVGTPRSNSYLQCYPAPLYLSLVYYSQHSRGFMHMCTHARIHICTATCLHLSVVCMLRSKLDTMSSDITLFISGRERWHGLCHVLQVYEHLWYRE